MKTYKCDMCGVYFDINQNYNIKEWKKNGSNMKIYVNISIDCVPINICQECICQTLHDQFIVDRETKQ